MHYWVSWGLGLSWEEESYSSVACIYLVYSKEWMTPMDIGILAKQRKNLNIMCACWFLLCNDIIYCID